MKRRLHGGVDISLVELALAEHEKVVGLRPAPCAVHDVGGAGGVHTVEVHEAHQGRAPATHAGPGCLSVVIDGIMNYWDDSILGQHLSLPRKIGANDHSTISSSSQNQKGFHCTIKKE